MVLGLKPELCQVSLIKTWIKLFPAGNEMHKIVLIHSSAKGYLYLGTPSLQYDLHLFYWVPFLGEAYNIPHILWEALRWMLQNLAIFLSFVILQSCLNSGSEMFLAMLSCNRCLIQTRLNTQFPWFSVQVIFLLACFFP